jgi:uncharacterized protein (TIGR03435 family)
VPETAVAAAPPGPGIVEAFRETLALRLVERRVPMDVLVIDHLEKEPIGN